MRKHPEKVKLKCQNPNCNKEFEVKWKQRYRKYCNPHCQVPWHKNKTKVYSNETLEKMKNSALERYKTKEGKSKKERLRKRNLSKNNIWRGENRTGKEEWENRRIESVRKAYENPEIRKKCASMTGKTHSPEDIKKMSSIRKKWWKDKDKIFRKEFGKKQSKIKKFSYDNGIIEIKRGKDSWAWKGGTSPLYNLIYANNKLYYDWKYPILKGDGFKCTECNSKEKLQVHHNKIKLSEIVIKFTKNIILENLNFTEKNSLVEKIVDYHVKNKISGITLCKKCHMKIHKRNK